MPEAIQRKPSCTCGGGCPRCGGAIQTRLMINELGDSYDQEADRVAEQVIATRAHPDVSDALPSFQRFSGQSNGQAEAARAVNDLTLYQLLGFETHIYEHVHFCISSGFSINKSEQWGDETLTN